MIEYSPYIEGIIPAFTTNELIIPFKMNPAVGKEEVKGFAVMIKDMGSAQPIARIKRVNQEGVTNNLALEKLNVNIPEKIKAKLNTGQFYKIQIAYMSDPNESLADLVYSSVATGKCIETPTMKILELENEDANIKTHRHYYTGIYSSMDISEPVYSYRFRIVKQATQEIVDDSGELLHNTFYDKIENNTRYCEQQWFSNVLLEENTIYKIYYSVTTVNGYENEKFYQLQSPNTGVNEFKDLRIIAENHENDGYVGIRLYNANNNETPYPASYVIYRKSSLDDYKSLDKIIEFSVSQTQKIDKDYKNFEWRDLSVEQGVKYVYELYKYTVNSATGVITHNRTISTKKVQEPLTAQFEDLFLSDNKKQLAIRFNPKVSNFKETVQETKVETIGSKYPFFFRNGILGYKEIPISGLISYQLDGAEMFMSKEELGLAAAGNMPTTNLVDYNITAERKFRMSVLEWLNNGQPKLFRSPTEGNYIVRLMNVSLQPNDTLGRMIYSFSATGYEVAECSYKNLYAMGLVDCVIEGKKTRKAGT